MGTNSIRRQLPIARILRGYVGIGSSPSSLSDSKLIGNTGRPSIPNVFIHYTNYLIGAALIDTVAFRKIAAEWEFNVGNLAQ